MAKIVGISGVRGSGKTLLCNPYLIRRGFKHLAFADVLKEDVRKSYNISIEHTDGKLKEVPCDKLNGKTPREAMIKEGQLRRYFDTMYWVRRVFERIDSLPTGQLVCISDVRFINEADFIKEKKGVLIRLERDPKLSIYKNAINDPSETEMNKYNGFSLTLSQERNKTPQDLERFADEITEYMAKIKS